MSTISLEDARRDLDGLFKRVVRGEVIVIQEAEHRVALHALPRAGDESEFPPPGYFAGDYSAEEIAELNQLASHGSTRIVP